MRLTGRILNEESRLATSKYYFPEEPERTTLDDEQQTYPTRGLANNGRGKPDIISIPEV